MLSKNRIKYIHSLELKKNRKNENVFLAEGHKLIADLLPCIKCRFLVATPEWISRQASIPTTDIIEVSEEELTRASLLKTPQEVLGVFEQPNYQIDYSLIDRSLSLALDDIQDPGNLGTIIRLADWFGIENIFCSPNTVDAYSPKTVQATMGAISRVKIYYHNLSELISSLGKSTPIYGTFLDGENFYEKKLSNNGLIVMGNEGNGISKEVATLINQRLYIPNYPANRETSESLNVAIATAVVCSEFRRQAALK
jgi:TrmH family RNA methyltransferase